MKSKILFIGSIMLFYTNAAHAGSVQDANRCAANCYALNYDESTCFDVCSVMSINAFSDMKKPDKCMAHCMAVNKRHDAFESCKNICSIFGKIVLP